MAARDAGAVAFLSKPFTDDAFSRAVEKALEDDRKRGVTGRETVYGWGDCAASGAAAPRGGRTTNGRFTQLLGE